MTRGGYFAFLGTLPIEMKKKYYSIVFLQKEKSAKVKVERFLFRHKILKVKVLASCDVIKIIQW